MISAAETLDYPGRPVSLPKFSTPHHPPLCPDIHTPYGNITLWTMCMFLIITLEINMRLQTICIKLVIFALQNRNLPFWMESLNIYERFQQRTMASTAVVGHKLRL